MHTTDPHGLPSRRAALFTLAGGAGLLVAGCGGGDNKDTSGNALIRAINLSSDIAGADLYFNDEKKFSALAADVLSENQSVNDQEWTLKLKKAGDATTLLSGSYSLGKDKHYTAVIWGRETAPRLSTLPEDEVDSAIASATSRLRVFNATLETGSLDVYITASSTELAETAASIGSVTAGQLSSFRDLSSGTYRLRVTGAGDPSDVRLDIADYVLAEKKHATLVLTPGTGGVLVNGRTVQQQSTSSAQKNTKARLRVVAGAEAAGNVAVTVGTRTLAGGLRSPSVGPYQLVDAGDAAVVVRINGAVVSSSTRTLRAGADYTLLAYGAGAVELIDDDNRLPTLTSRVKLRLVHGVAGVEPLTLSVDYLALASDLALGKASPHSTINVASSARIDVTAASAAAPIYTATEVNLQSQAVYTVFVLGGNSTPTGVIRKER
jgi:Domain of unknown function (DUF4397)